MPRKPVSPEQRKGCVNEKNLFFAENIRAFRLALGLKQSELGECLGMTTKQISELEGGRFVQDATRLVALCRALETDPNHLFGFREES
jgi:transcriptional regulator with XRE-family HTH domain